MQEDVFEILLKFGIPMNTHGYWFFREAADIVDKEPEKLLYICKSIYPEVASKFHTSKYAVERSMRLSVTKAWDSGNIVKGLNDVTDIDVCLNTKPTNTEFMTILMESLWLRQLKKDK